MIHFYNCIERALMKIFGKGEKDVLIRYGKFLARKIKRESKQAKIKAGPLCTR